MNTKKVKLKNPNISELLDLKKKITNVFTGNAEEAGKLIVALIDKMAGDEMEIDLTALADGIMEIINSMTEDKIPQAINDQIVKQISLKMESIKNSINPKEKLTNKVKNEIAAEILKNPKSEVKNAVEKVLVKNGITGLTFEEIIDYEVATKWEDLNPLYAKFHQTYFTQFHYNDDDWKTAEMFAKGWKETNTGVKVIQELTLKLKTIVPRFVYKKQELPLEDLVRLDRNGRQSEFLSWLNREIDMILVNSIVIAILIGDNINTGQNRIVSFDPIATVWDSVTNSFILKTTPDNWTSIRNYTGTAPTVQDVREMCDLIFNPNSKEKILIMNQKLLTKLSEFRYGTGGTVMYRMKEEMAGQFGVSDIYVTDALDSVTDLAAMVIIPDGYWINEDIYISVDYPTWETNRHSYQKERMIGGTTRDLLSTAILTKA